jgi:hypothetical protein
VFRSQSAERTTSHPGVSDRRSRCLRNHAIAIVSASRSGSAQCRQSQSHPATLDGEQPDICVDTGETAVVHIPFSDVVLLSSNRAMRMQCVATVVLVHMPGTSPD